MSLVGQVAPPSVDLRSTPFRVAQPVPAALSTSPVAASTVTVAPTLLIANLMFLCGVLSTRAVVAGAVDGLCEAVEASVIL